MTAVAALILSGCVSREQADTRLARGCAAAAELFIEEGNRIKAVKAEIFRDDAALGKGYREVLLQAVETDGWYEADKEYKCVFAESLAPFGLRHTASLYQVTVNGETYGKQGEEILGSFQDHLRLTETVEKAMN